MGWGLSVGLGGKMGLRGRGLDKGAWSGQNGAWSGQRGRDQEIGGVVWSKRAWPRQVGGRGLDKRGRGLDEEGVARTMGGVVWTNGGVARTKCGLHKGGVVWTKGRGFGEWGRGHVVGVASDCPPLPIQDLTQEVVDVASGGAGPDAPPMEGYLYKRASNAFRTWSRYPPPAPKDPPPEYPKP